MSIGGAPSETAGIETTTLSIRAPPVGSSITTGVHPVGAGVRVCCAITGPSQNWKSQA